jgi:hypothetical protein
LRSYSDARAVSGKVTSDFYCGASLVTTAGKPGSLVEQEGCGVTEFDSDRPFFWDIPVIMTPVVDDGEQEKLTNCGLNACVGDIMEDSSKKERSRRSTSMGFRAIIDATFLWILLHSSAFLGMTAFS